MSNILVVDDELGIRDLLSEILNDEGHHVELAENAAQARAARAWAAFSANSTVWPSSLRISQSNSRMPCSSSTTSMFAMLSAQSL